MKSQFKSEPIMFEIHSDSMTSIGFDIQSLQTKRRKCFYLIHPASVGESAELTFSKEFEDTEMSSQ